MKPVKFGQLLSIGLLVICASTLARADEVPPASWSEIQEATDILLEQDEFDKALALVEEATSGLTDRDFEISDLTMRILFDAGRTDDALTVWEKGLENGYFYFVIPRYETFDAVRGTDRFKTALARNNRLREMANSKSKPEYSIVTPAGYSSEGSYPLVMVIHGGNQSIVKAMGRWNPTTIGDDHIIAYVQSSQRADTKSYRWDLGGVDIYSLPTAQNEVVGLYREIVEEYAVDTGRVILAGFSQGGNLSLFLAAEGTIPAKGFIAGCPATRTPISPEIAEAAAVRGVRGTIFVGANDWTAASAQTSVTNFKEAGLSINHIVMEDKGHEYPAHFDDVLQEAIKHIHQ